jgi:glycosyltransferase involved in cell wall biosynthesis
MQTVLPEKLRRDRIDLLVCPNAEGLLKPIVPQILTIHDLIPLFYREENPIQHHYYRLVLPRLIRRSKLVIAVSEYTKQDLIKHYAIAPEKISVATSGIDAEVISEESDNLSALSRYFLYVGNFSPRKNLATVLRAFASIARNVPEYLVLVAYPDRWQSSIVDLVNSLGISERVVVKSGISRDELTTLYRKSTALVLLSEYEGFGLPPLEAMSLGTPAIVSNCTSLAEVTCGGAIQTPPQDVAAAANAMREFSQDPELRERYSRLGRIRAMNFNQSQCLTRLKSALQPIIESAAAGSNMQKVEAGHC